MHTYVILYTTLYLQKNSWPSISDFSHYLADFVPTYGASEDYNQFLEPYSTSDGNFSEAQGFHSNLFFEGEIHCKISGSGCLKSQGIYDISWAVGKGIEYQYV